MADYSTQIANAQRLIAAKGAVCIWRKLANAAPPDSDQPHLPGNITTTNNDVTSVIFPFDNYARSTFNLENRDVASGYAYALFGAVDFDPAVTDLMIDADSIEWRAKAISVIAPSGDPILYTVLLER